jgi:hypothetical protein
VGLKVKATRKAGKIHAQITNHSHISQQLSVCLGGVNGKADHVKQIIVESGKSIVCQSE